MTASQVALESFRWYVTLSIIAWLMYPLLFRTLAALPDRGLSIVRPLGLLLAALMPWWLSAIGLLPYTNPFIIAIPVAIAILVWGYELRSGEIIRFLRQRIISLIVYETMTLALFVGYVVFRSYNPAIQHTEKPMELAFLTSIEHARSMPPSDPWFLGHSINYYYLGYLLMALPARITHILPSHAFNLALATLFATATVAAAGTAVNVMLSWGKAQRWMVVLSGTFASVFLVGIGNLYTPIKFIEHPIRTLDAGWWVGIGWNASRVIVDGPSAQTINEFPAFSFVLGDLHPHILAYPMFISSIAVGFALVRSGRERKSLYPAATLAGVLAAALYATNSWDMPPALLLAAIGILIATLGLRWSQKAYPLAILVASAFVTVLPFEVNYTPAVGLQGNSVPESIKSTPILGKLVETIGIVTWPKSSTSEILTVHGLFLLIALVFLAPIALPVLRKLETRKWIIEGCVAILLLISVIIRFPGLFWFVGPLIVLFIVCVVGKYRPALRYLLSLFGVAFLLLSITELVFLEDAFSDRMNTVFKLYFQVWAIFAIACAVALPLCIQRVRTYASRLGTAAIFVPIAVVVLGAALYPPISAYRWTNGFAHFSGIDGLAYLAQGAPTEFAAIDWLNAHAAPADHILEAPGCSYGEDGVMPDNLFSMATGLQTPLGWQFHEYQWRLGDPTISNQIAERKADVATIYNTPTSSAARELLDSYDIKYIVDGPIEQLGYGAQCDGGAPYSATGLQALSQLGWPVAFQADGVTVYQRPEPGK